MSDTEVLVIGGGLSGLSAALRLAHAGHRVIVLESRPWVGGRTASWDDNGMRIESGLHRVIGTYREVPEILRLAGFDLEAITIYQDEVEMRSANGPSAVYGASMLHAPGRTIKGVIGNNHYLSAGEKLTFSRFFAAGTAAMVANPRRMDTITVAEFARDNGMDEETILKILEPFTAGVLFLPPDKFSAYVFFRLMLSFAPRSTTMRLGVYAGGMTEVLANPLAAAVRSKGSEVRTGVDVESLVLENGRVLGAETSVGRVLARHTVLATSLAAAKKIVAASLPSHTWFQPMLSLETTAAVAVQLDLDSPALPVDRITFGPGTALACFAEQSRTTFKREGGRLSIFLADAERFLDQPPNSVLNHVVADARKIGLELEGRIQDFRVVFHEHDFHSLKPGHNHLRPPQKTPVAGLTLAGDYTRHRFPATMEGAALSARRAAEIVNGSIKKSSKS